MKQNSRRTESLKVIYADFNTFSLIDGAFIILHDDQGDINKSEIPRYKEGQHVVLRESDSDTQTAIMARLTYRFEPFLSVERWAAIQIEDLSTD